MRNIKFRGFGVSDKQWHYGFLTIYESGKHIVGGFEVYGESVGQLTELKDKNGKEIYEGDVVNCYCELLTNWGKNSTGKFTTSRYEIVFNEGCWSTREIYNDRWSKTWNNYGLINRGIKSLCEKFYEICGNSYENKDLLST